MGNCGLATGEETICIYRALYPPAVCKGRRLAGSSQCWIQTSLGLTAASAPYLHWDSGQVKDTLKLNFLLCNMGKLYPLHHYDKQGSNFNS